MFVLGVDLLGSKKTLKTLEKLNLALIYEIKKVYSFNSFDLIWKKWKADLLKSSVDKHTSLAIYLPSI